MVSGSVHVGDRLLCDGQEDEGSANDGDHACAELVAKGERDLDDLDQAQQAAGDERGGDEVLGGPAKTRSRLSNPPVGTERDRSQQWRRCKRQSEARTQEC